MEKLHHHGGDLEHKGRSTSGQHDAAMTTSALPADLEPSALHRLGAAKEILDNWTIPAEIPQGHAGRIPPRAARDGTHAHGIAAE
jgi:hypothetical protein